TRAPAGVDRRSTSTATGRVARAVAGAEVRGAGTSARSGSGVATGVGAAGGAVGATADSVAAGAGGAGRAPRTPRTISTATAVTASATSPRRIHGRTASRGTGG